MFKKERLFSVTVYFNKEEYTQVRRLAKTAGLSLSDVVRMCTKYVINEVMPYQSFVSVVSKASEEKGKE